MDEDDDEIEIRADPRVSEVRLLHEVDTVGDDAPDGLYSSVTNRNLTCAWCGTGFERPVRRGPVPKYCCAAHRQQAYRARQMAAFAEHAAGADIEDLAAEAEAALRRPSSASDVLGEQLRRQMRESMKALSGATMSAQLVEQMRESVVKEFLK